jgi:hypothetical protein
MPRLHVSTLLSFSGLKGFATRREFLRPEELAV